MEHEAAVSGSESVAIAWTASWWARALMWLGVALLPSVLPISDVLVPAFVALPGFARLALQSPGLAGVVIFIVFLVLPLAVFLAIIFAIRRHFPQSPGTIILALMLFMGPFGASGYGVMHAQGYRVVRTVESLLGWSAAVVMVALVGFVVQASIIRRRQRESA